MQACAEGKFLLDSLRYFNPKSFFNLFFFSFFDNQKCCYCDGRRSVLHIRKYFWMSKEKIVRSDVNMYHGNNLVFC